MNSLDRPPPSARLSFPSYREALFHDYLVSELLNRANAKPNNNQEPGGLTHKQVIPALFLSLGKDIWWGNREFFGRVYEDGRVSHRGRIQGPNHLHHPLAACR